MGALIREKDWSATPVDDIRLWPQNLRITLGIMLHSRFPMFLFWGPELTCFYNDAYRPSLGVEGKHPRILGMPGEEAWPEIWPVIYPLICQVREKGEATWSADQLIPIHRNGQLEDVYWTFSYSPVYDEAGLEVEGVFVTCTETTEAILNLHKREESEKKFQDVLREAPVATAVLTGEDFIIEIANKPALQLWAKDESVIGKRLLDAIPELAVQSFPALLREVYLTGNTHQGNESKIFLEQDGQLRQIYVNFIFKALRDHSGRIYGILAMGYDVTREVEARQQVEHSQRQFYNLIAQSPAALGILKGEDLVVTVANEAMMSMWGKGKDVIGRPVLEVVPELAEQGYDALLKQVYKTGTAYHEYESPFRLLRNGVCEEAYFTFSYQPYREVSGEITGATILAYEVTTKALANLQVADSEQRFRNTVMQAPAGISIFRGRDFIVEMANEAYLQLIDVPEKELLGHSLFDSIPEVEEIVRPLLTRVLETGIAFHATEFKVTLNRYGKSENAYFNMVYQPLREVDGSVSGVMVVATEVTRQVEARHALEESDKRFRSMVMQSPIGMTIFRGPDLVIEMPNETLLKKIWHKKEEEVVGRKALEVFPELKEQKFPELLQRVMTTGISHREDEAIAFVQGNEGMKKFYLDFEYAPLFDTEGKVDGVMITVNDVTERVESRQFVQDAAERLTLATEGTQLATWDLNLQTRDIVYSQRLTEIFDYHEPAPFTHQAMRDRIHPDDLKPVVEKAFKEALQHGTYFYEARVLLNDQSIRWIRTHGKVIYDKENQPVRMLGTLMDITDQKRTAQIIEENQRRFRLLAEAVPQFVWTADKLGQITYFNQALYDYSGYLPGQLYNNDWLQIVHNDDREETITRWNEALAGGHAYRNEHRFRRHDGEYRWQLSRGIPQKDANGDIQFWVGTSTDIDDLKKHEQQKDDFIKMASHELKTPVTSIKGYIQLLQKKHASDPDQFLALSLATIDKQVSKLTKLITDLLDMTKIETGGLQLHRESFLLADLVGETVQDMRTSTQTHTLVLEAHDNPTVFADKDRIGQVINNLVTNAIKYSPQADRIEVSVWREDRTAIVSVRDFGIGIAPEDHEKIFERFYRVQGREEKTYPGFGIGLFIVSQIINDHQGKVWIESEKNKGAVFYISLPVQD